MRSNGDLFSVEEPIAIGIIARVARSCRVEQRSLIDALVALTLIMWVADRDSSNARPSLPVLCDEADVVHAAITDPVAFSTQKRGGCSDPTSVGASVPAAWPAEGLVLE